MAKSSTGVRRTPKNPAKAAARLATLAKRGVTNADGVAALMLTLGCEVLLGGTTWQQANAAANCCGKAMKAVEMQEKYGRLVPAKNGRKQLALTG
jgi:rhamnose utilization protein RhaD (predicted bifunctional aldolase and dehydrogenase)